MERAAGIILVSGFVMVLLASLIGPNRVYSAPDAQTRLDIIAGSQGRWAATNLVWAIASLVTAVGMGILTLALRGSETPWLLYAGGLAFLIGAVAWAVYLYQRMVDPAGYLYTTPPAPLSLVFVWATLAALAIYGLAFILGSYPTWLGYSLIGFAGLLTAGLLLFFDAVYASFPPQLFYLMVLVIGIVALRR